MQLFYRVADMYNTSLKVQDAVSQDLKTRIELKMIPANERLPLCRRGIYIINPGTILLLQSNADTL
jgi:hypothetical protein